MNVNSRSLKIGLYLLKLRTNVKCLYFIGTDVVVILRYLMLQICQRNGVKDGQVRTLSFKLHLFAKNRYFKLTDVCVIPYAADVGGRDHYMVVE